MDPRIADAIHIPYPDAIQNRDNLPCRAAIVTAPAREGRIPVTVFPVFHNPYPDVAYQWHYPQDCPRTLPSGYTRAEPESDTLHLGPNVVGHLHFESPNWVCPDCNWRAGGDLTHAEPIELMEVDRG